MSDEKKDVLNDIKHELIGLLTKDGLNDVLSGQIYTKVSNILNSNDKSSIKWQKISKTILTKKMGFKIHEYLFKQTYKNDNKDEAYIWIPNNDEMKQTNLYQLITKSGKNDLNEYFNYVDNNREQFFETMIEILKCKFISRKNNKIFDLTNGVTKPIYLPETTMNACDLILIGDDNRNVITWSREGNCDNNGKPILNYIKLKELKSIVNKIAYGLTHKLKLKKGDAIAIDMPMNWESVAIYLGIIKAGMIVISIADSFAPNAIQIRLKIGKAKAIFTQDIIPRGNKKIELYNRILKCDKDIMNGIQCICLSYLGSNNKLVSKLRDNDINFDDFMLDNKDTFDSVEMNSMDIANILFSSGTTGEPKAIPWYHVTFLKPLIDGYIHHDVKPNDVCAWPTNLGWMMGPWLITMIGLNASIALYVGTPTGKAFCKFVELSKINMLGLIPSMVKSWMKLDCVKDCDWSNITRYSSTGEASNPTLYHWLMIQSEYKPVLEYVGGTEIAGGYLSGTMMQPQLLSAFSMPCFGLNIHIIDGTGKFIDTGEGELTISIPSIGLSTNLLNRNHETVYYDGMPKYNDKPLRRHGDEIRILKNGYYQHLGRCDDTMNIGGIKVSSIELENEITKHPLLSKECAAISYRKQEVDTEKLVICCVPNNTDKTTFTVEYNAKPLGITIAPGILNNNIAIVTKSKNNELNKYIIYKINDKIMFGKSFESVISYIKSINTYPLIIQYINGLFSLDKIKRELQIMVKTNINPLYRVHDIYVIPKLPRTASGKVMRRILRKQYSNSL